MILDRIEKGLNKASLGTYSDLKNLSSDHRDAKAGTAGELVIRRIRVLRKKVKFARSTP